RLGYEVIAATDPIEALEIIRQERGFDAIITDQIMPSMSGDELIREFKRTNPRAVAILCSGYHEARTDRPAGADLYLDKPLEPSELAAALRRLFAGERSVPDTQEPV
ncbi:MAG TPA: response regulator, partial [Rhizomicrobium sp.]|nr:response regulator [Rhizomicrobium sp.]